MNLENILAVTGMPGLYKLIATRSNGLIIEDFDNGKRTFISMRKHQFTPVESIGIYTYGDVIDIKDVFAKLADSGDRPEPNAPGHELHKYFRTVLQRKSFSFFVCPYNPAQSSFPPPLLGSR